MSNHVIRLCLTFLILCVACAKWDPPPLTKPIDGSVIDLGPPDEKCEGKSDNDPCDDDGDGCTTDVCLRGACTTTGRVTCEGGCGIECVSTGPLTHECRATESRKCAIEGECYPAGLRQPGNEACGICSPSQSTTEWSVLEAACDDNDACTVDDVCTNGECKGTPKQDEFEPNDNKDMAPELGRIDDQDDFPSGTISGDLADETEDWFKYHVEDKFGLSGIRPRAVLKNIPEGSNYDLCIYTSCSVDDCEDGSTREDIDGLRGCCSRVAGNANEGVQVDHDCSGTDDSSDVWVRVIQVEGPPQCTSYTLDWGDD